VRLGRQFVHHRRGVRHIRRTGDVLSPAEQLHRDRLTGIALMCGAVFLFAGNDAAAKYLNGHMHTIEVVWARYMSAFVLALVMFNPIKRPKVMRTARPWLQLGRSALLLMSTALNFVALRYLQLDQAIAIIFSTPFMVAVLGGPLPHVMAAKAVALAEASQPAFGDYAAAIVGNARALAEGLIRKGVPVVTGGTDNHLVLVDVRPFGLNGRQAEAALRASGITLNRNVVPDETNGAWYTSGLRMGTPALTTLGMGIDEMREIAEVSAAVLHATSAGVIESGPNAGKPSLVQFRLDEEIAKALALPEVRDAFAKQGVEIFHMGPNELGKFLQSEAARFASLLRNSRVKGTAH